MSSPLRCLCMVLALGGGVSRADDAPVPETELRAAAEKSLPLLMKAMVGHRENRECFACHHQGIPLFAFSAARVRGFEVDAAELETQQQAIAAFLATNRDEYLRGEGQGGGVDTAGYALSALSAAGWKPDETTAAVAEYLLLANRDDDHWSNTSRRPPSEASPLTTTAVALRGLAAYATAEQRDRAQARREQVLGWLLRTPPNDTEERVFRLLALQAAGADPDVLRAAAGDLLVTQHDDGGWSQLDGGEPETARGSDAYATGTALVALREAGGMATADTASQRGLRFLLNSQGSDGSWHVVSRSKPFQTYFETGFPHGHDQFLSCAASAWATLAIVAAIEPAP